MSQTPKPIFADTYFDDVNLSEEARQVSKEAADAMRTWITQSLNQLEESLKKEGEEALKQLENAQKEVLAGLEGMDKNLAGLDKAIADAIKQPGGALKPETIQAMLASVEGMKTELAERKAKAERIGATSFGVLKKAVSGLAGVPL